jgi:hypothetical protein
LTVELPAQAAAQQNLSHQQEAQSTVKELATHFADKPGKRQVAEIDRLLRTMEPQGAIIQWNEK